MLHTVDNQTNKFYSNALYVFSNATLRMCQWTYINKNPLAVRREFKLEPFPKHNPLAHQWETR